MGESSTRQVPYRSKAHSLTRSLSVPSTAYHFLLIRTLHHHTSLELLQNAVALFIHLVAYTARSSRISLHRSYLTHLAHSPAHASPVCPNCDHQQSRRIECRHRRPFSDAHPLTFASTSAACALPACVSGSFAFCFIFVYTRSRNFSQVHLRRLTFECSVN